MARRKAQKTVKKSTPSPVREAKDEAVNDEDGMLKFAVIPIFFPEAGI